MDQTIQQSIIKISLPNEFDFQQCLVFLTRSEQEVMHQVRDSFLYKLIKIDQEFVLCKISYQSHVLLVHLLLNVHTKNIQEAVVAYIREWFDLDRDLRDFYLLSLEDKVLQEIVPTYFGLRIIGIPDLFEALTWAVIGQQINLAFAYTLKKRFVERFGESLSFEGITYWLFPSPDVISNLQVQQLIDVQFTRRKAEYIIDIAKAIANGQLTKQMLLQQGVQQMTETLLSLRGIGAWSANYVMMKCLHHASAFPIADVGLQNALKRELKLERKPTVEEIKEVSKNWGGYEAYATFYLWQSLSD